MNQTHRLIISIVLFAALSALLSLLYAQNKAKQAAQVASMVATSTDIFTASDSGKTEAVAPAALEKVQKYVNQNVSFSSSQKLVTNLNSDHQFVLSRTIGGKSSFVEMYLGKTGDCYMDFCKASAERTEVHNGLTWEFLGNPEYCDGKECSQPSALYRTKTAEKDIYLAFFEYGPMLNTDVILETFVIK